MLLGWLLRRENCLYLSSFLGTIFQGLQKNISVEPKDIIYKDHGPRWEESLVSHILKGHLLKTRPGQGFLLCYVRTEGWLDSTVLRDNCRMISMVLGGLMFLGTMWTVTLLRVLMGYVDTSSQGMTERFVLASPCILW